MSLLRRLFGLPRPRPVIDLPAVCPRLYSVDEIRAALSGQKDKPEVQAMLQLLGMTRAIYLEEAQKLAAKGAVNHYQHGGLAAIEDTLAEALNTLNAAPPSDDVKRFFPAK